MTERLYTMMVFSRGRDVVFAHGVTDAAWRALFPCDPPLKRPADPQESEAWLVLEGIGASDRDAQRRAVLLAEMNRGFPKEKT